MYSLIVQFIDVQPYTHNIDYHICNMRYSKKVQTAVQKRYHRKEARAATTTTSISVRSSILSREIFSTCEQKGTAMADRRNQIRAGRLLTYSEIIKFKETPKKIQI